MSPFINYGVDNIKKKQLGLLVIALYVLSFRGFSCLLVFIYLLGRYLRNYPIDFIEKNAGKIFICTLFTFFCVNLYFLHVHVQPEKIYNYMSPFNVTAAVAIFYVFKRMKINSRLIGSIASGVLAAYLVTSHEIMQIPFNNAILNIFGDNIFVLLCISFIVVLLFALLDIVITTMLNKISPA